jgi:hypothetical protein
MQRRDLGREASRGTRKIRAALVSGGLFSVVLVWGPAGWASDPPGDFSVTGEASESDGSPSPAPVPEVRLESLLKLPSSWSGSEVKRQGLSAGQWRARFSELAEERLAVEQGVEEARDELDGMVEGGTGGPWQMAAPGSNNTEVTPMSFKHRELIRDGKEQLTNIRRRERSLHIEADIAGVPSTWRVVPTDSAP